MAKVLVVDDEESIIWSFRRLLESMGHTCLSCATAEQALVLGRREQPDLVILDVKLPGMDGLTALDALRKDLPNARFLVITAHGTLETAVRAHRAGTSEYLIKPLDVGTVGERIRLLLKGIKPDAEVEEARRKGEGRAGIVGRSAHMQEIFKKIAAVTQSDTTVLLVGESGTGKELLARAIHHNGPRADGPFEAINCAALPESLVESELYGHALGAFTDAVREKPGKFQMADGGTVFLDEVGDLSPQAQAKLLRFLEDRRVVPVGATTGETVNVRVIAATNRNLERMIREGRFREDLYFRLNVMRIEVPPLRERKEDLVPLVAHFLERAGGAGIASEAMQAIRSHSWPGNVRELRNAIERGAILAGGGIVRLDHLPPAVLQGAAPLREQEEGAVRALVSRMIDGGSPGQIYRVVEEQWEKALLETVLRRVDGNKVKAARFLGINRMTLRRKLVRYGLLRE
jgi:two-component system nitrogen regulation response regulator GlnG